MAQDLTKKVKIVIEATSAGAEKSFNAIGGSMTELNSKIELVRKGFSFLSGATSSFFSVLERGSAVIELKDSFDKLYGSANQLGKDGLTQLRVATGGLISDMDLLRKANAAATAGIPKEAFLELAKAAEKLGDNVQKDAKTALDDLTNALIRGGAKSLTDYGIRLDEVAGKGQNASEVFKKIIERSKALGAGIDTAGDKVGRIKNQFSTATDAIFEAVASNDELLHGLDELSKAIANFNWKPIIEGLGLVIHYTAEAVDGWSKFVGYLAGSSTTTARDKMADLNLELDKATKRADEAFKNKDSFFGQIEFENATKRVAMLEKEKKALEPLVDAELKKLKATKDGTKADETADEALKRLEPQLKKLNQTTDENAKKAKDAADKWADFAKQIEKNRLDKAIKAAIDSGDVQGFEKLRSQIESFTRQGLTDAFGNLVDPGVAQEAVNQVLEPLDEGFKESAEKLQKELEDKFQKSVDFFADVFENAITGTTFDLEDALKRLAVGFAAQLAASIATSLGFDFSGITGLQGLGGALGSTLAGAIGLPTSGSGLGGILGGLLGAGAGAALAPAAPQLISATAGVGGGAVAGTAVAGSTLAATLGTAAIAGLVAVALPFALSGATKFFGKIFGGSQDPDELARRAFRKELSKTGLGEDLILPTVQGDVKLSQIDYKKFSQTFAGKDFGDQALGLVAPFSQVLTGGGKLGEDFALIFAQAVGNAKNYNEVIINTLSLMSKLGVSAGEAKDQFKELFLDGKVTLDQFTVGVQNLNFIAQEDLVGPNSVADAINAIATAIDSPRVQLKALELSFKEMAQLGIDTSAEIYAYLIDKWGPGVADVFKALTDAGIDTWQEIANASADQLVTIFNALKNLNVDMQAELSRTAKTVVTTFNDAGTKAASEFEKATDPVIKRLREIGEEAVKTGGIMDYVTGQISSSLKGVDTKVTDTKKNLGGISGTVPNNEFRA